MSVTPGLGAFNKDKVANKFGIQLKPKGTAQGSAANRTSTTTPTPSAGTSNVTKNKTISDFRTDSSTNGFLLNKKTTETIPTKKPIEKTETSKSTSNVVNTTTTTTTKTNEQPKKLISNDNHSTKKSATTTTLTPTTAPPKRSSITSSTERAVSPTPPIKRPSVAKTEAKTEAQKDQPLYRRQLSKPIENASSSSTTTTAATTTSSASTTSLKR